MSLIGVRWSEWYLGKSEWVKVNWRGKRGGALRWAGVGCTELLHLWGRSTQEYWVGVSLHELGRLEASVSKLV